MNRLAVLWMSQVFIAMTMFGCVEGVERRDRWASVRPQKQERGASRTSKRWKRFEARKSTPEATGLTQRVQKVLERAENIRIVSASPREVLPPTVRRAWTTALGGYADKIYEVEVKSPLLALLPSLNDSQHFTVAVIPVERKPIASRGALPVVYFLWTTRIRDNVSPRIVETKLREFNQSASPVAAELFPDGKTLVVLGWYVVREGEPLALESELPRAIEEFALLSVMKVYRRLGSFLKQ